MLKIVAARSGGVCGPCYSELRGPRRQVELKDRGRRFTASLTPGKYKPKPVTERRRQRVQLKRKAQAQAMKRLADRHRTEYEELYAEERAALGLPAWTVDGALRAGIGAK